MRKKNKDRQILAAEKVGRPEPQDMPIRQAASPWVRCLPPILLLVFAALAAAGVVQKSPTYDETHYLGVGRYVLTHGRWDLPDVIRHPPLSSVIHGLPLLWVDIPEDIWKERDAYVRGQKIMALGQNDRLLNVCRLAILPMGMLLGWIVFLWSRALYGTIGGLLSLTLFCFCPNILAHAPLITPDMTLSAMTVLSLYRLWRFARAPSRPNLFWAGLALGLALLAKHTALLLIPILMAADLAYRWRTGQIVWRKPATLWRAGRHWPGILLMTFVLVWMTFGFGVGELTLPSGAKIPMFAVPYFQDVVFQWIQSRAPHSFFLMGMYSTEGWWYYYLVALLIKLPLGTLILAMGLWPFCRKIGGRSDEIFLIAPFILLLIHFSFFSTLDCGVRYLLPVYPLILVWIGRYAGAVQGSRMARIVVSLLVGWVVGASLWVWPHELAYFNELAGGPSQGYHWLGDSNLDWGQDLKGLKRFMSKRGIKRVRLSYFGTADPAHYGIDYEYLPSANSPLREPPPLPAGEQRSPIVAISAYQYQAIDFENKDAYAFFHSYEPNDLIGYSILVYDLNALKPRRDAPFPVKLLNVGKWIDRRMWTLFGG